MSSPVFILWEEIVENAGYVSIGRIYRNCMMSVISHYQDEYRWCVSIDRIYEVDHTTGAITPAKGKWAKSGRTTTLPASQRACKRAVDQLYARMAKHKWKGPPLPI